MVSGNITERIGITARLDIVAVQRPFVHLIADRWSGVKVLAAAIINYHHFWSNCSIGVSRGRNGKGAYLESYSNYMVSGNITESIGIAACLDIVAVQRPFVHLVT